MKTMSNMHGRQWWAMYRRKMYGPYESREQAARSVFISKPNADTVMTGYGSFGPSFDIRWYRLEGKATLVSV